MAAAALLSSPAARLSLPRGTAAATMPVARPKSAKGRRRPSFSCSRSPGTWPRQAPPSPPAAPRRPLAESRRGALGAEPSLPAGPPPPGEVPALLQQVPVRSCSSLNRYRVLPSIGCRGAAEGLAERTDRLSLAEGQEDAPQAGAPSGRDGPAAESSGLQRPPEKPGRKTGQESPARSASGGEEPELLLAVRSPCGQRFQHRFKPTDSLQSVLAVAEQRTSCRYKHCCLETMEVPRRSFSDLSRSLHECGILHKSVLCIRPEEQHHPDL